MTFMKIAEYVIKCFGEKLEENNSYHVLQGNGLFNQNKSSSLVVTYVVVTSTCDVFSVNCFISWHGRGIFCFSYDVSGGRLFWV